MSSIIIPSSSYVDIYLTAELRVSARTVTSTEELGNVIPSATSTVREQIQSLDNFCFLELGKKDGYVFINTVCTENENKKLECV